MATEAEHETTMGDDIEIVRGKRGHGDGIEVVRDNASADGTEIVRDSGDGDQGIEIVRDSGDGDQGIAIVREGVGDDVGVEIVQESDGDGGATTVVDSAAVTDTNTELDTDAEHEVAIGRVEVVVVDDAFITADHADAQQVFAAAARLRPVFAALSVVLMICVALAAYGVSVLLAA